jgi:hypothetical protein
LQVERPEQLADHGPMELLADQRQTDQFMQRCLELATKGCALVWLHEGRQMARRRD